MSSFKARRRNRTKDINDILSTNEKENKKQIQNIQHISLDDFQLLVETLTENNVKISLDNHENFLKNYLNKLKQQDNDKELIQLIEFRELLRQYRIILNKSETLEPEIKSKFIKMFDRYDNQNNKLIDSVVSMRKRDKDAIEFQNNNLIANASLNIHNKILSYANPDSNIPQENLNLILESIIIDLQDKLTSTTRSDVIVQYIEDKKDGPKLIKLANPLKFFKNSYITSHDNAETLIDSIQGFILLLGELKKKIINLPNVKRKQLGSLLIMKEVELNKIIHYKNGIK